MRKSVMAKKRYRQKNGNSDIKVVAAYERSVNSITVCFVNMVAMKSASREKKTK